MKSNQRLLSSASSITRSIKSPFPLNDSLNCSRDFLVALSNFFGMCNLHKTTTSPLPIPRLEGTPLDEIVIVSPELVPAGTLMTKSLSSICGKVTDVPRA